tara:strand:+ start:99 stop:320 length:222 start_codon:yes stop_codon:yes gene_type:complete
MTHSETTRHLQTVHGIGLIPALAVEAFAPPMESYRCGREFAPWLGLVPHQYSSNHKELLGRVSEAGKPIFVDY